MIWIEYKNIVQTEVIFGIFEILQKKEGIMMKKLSSVLNSKSVIDDNVRAIIHMCFQRAAF